MAAHDAVLSGGTATCTSAGNKGIADYGSCEARARQFQHMKVSRLAFAHKRPRRCVVAAEHRRVLDGWAKKMGMREGLEQAST